MVRILTLLLTLWAGPALAQAEFSTIISPTTLGTSPLAVTFGSSPFSAIITNTVTTSAVAGGSYPVTVLGTPTVSLASSPFVQQGTNPWTVNGTVSASLTTSTPFVNINTIPTVTTSAVAGAIAVNVNNTPTVSLSTSTPFFNINTAPTITASLTTGTFVTVTPSPSPMAVIQTSGFTSVTSPLATVANSAAVVNVMAAGTSPLAITLAVSPLAVSLPGSPAMVTITNSPAAVAEQNGLAYPNRANFKQGSVTTTGTASAVVIGAPAANKLYITALQCWRSDNPVIQSIAVSPMTMRFNDPAAQFTVVVGSSGQTNMTLVPALVISATTSFQFSASTSLTSVGCNAQGYNAP